MKDFYTDKTAKVYYDPELDTLFLEYTDKVINDEQFIRINTAVLNAFTTLNTQKFVADIRKMGIISLNSQRWVLENLLPGMIQHLKGKTLFHAQFLDASEIMSKVAASNIKGKAAQVAEGFEVVQFSDRSKMMDYLKRLK
jgi:hypothetical protein